MTQTVEPKQTVALHYHDSESGAAEEFVGKLVTFDDPKLQFELNIAELESAAGKILGFLVKPILDADGKFVRNEIYARCPKV